MGRRGVFFQIYLNPSHPEDQEIIRWLQSIPRSRRSQKVRESLLSTIRKVSQQSAAVPINDRSSHEASGIVKNFMGSVSKKAAT